VLGRREQWSTPGRAEKSTRTNFLKCILHKKLKQGKKLAIFIDKEEVLEFYIPVLGQRAKPKNLTPPLAELHYSMLSLPPYST
jgi:hypothetical protein